MRETRPPSMADVAERAGVSHQTVSRVLNGHAYVRPDTRDRVQAAIDELGYRRNQAARALVTARTATIGVLTAGTTHYGPTSTVLAVEAAAREEGYYISVGALSGAGSARPVFEQLMDQGVDGVVVVAPLDEVAHLMDDVAPAVPVVVVAARPDIPERSPIRYVAVDQLGGAMLATEHLLGLGHERIVHVAGPDGWYDAAQRAEGHRRLLAERGLEPRLVAAEGWSAKCGYDAGTRLVAELRTADAPTAVFAANDYLAMGLLRAFWERGVRVPEDVSLVGFDDIDGSGFLVPALTTVRQPFAAVGEAAIHALLDHWSADSSQDAGGLVALIAPELVVRDSTAAPRT